ncbi:MAG: hypothetical protein AVDCRST_MAG86-2169 [uncultured Truepera sp.]|uniref:Uncharacterized protein n=1 Tax=uncultured Truepera sp. TaxID=543023 RepID=A0A6J4VDC4_9DEIN|nr:MAG: hypothetical protein AVDCRST_MAG86-2169 [uncultured Truepera sp.]
MSQTEKPFDVKGSNVDQVLAEVKAGRLSPQDALNAEKAGEPVRSGITGPLEKMIADAKAAQEETEVTSDDQKVSPQDPAPSVRTAIQDPPKKPNPNNYPEVKVKVSQKVLDTTAGRGSYFDHEQKEDVGKEPVTVLATPFINALIRNQELDTVS